jgi:hypothetical protein
VYRVEADEPLRRQVDALPVDGQVAFAELRVVLEVAPWSGEPINPTNPDGAVRVMAFGADSRGLASYVILDDQRRVELVQIAWFG